MSTPLTFPAEHDQSYCRHREVAGDAARGWWRCSRCGLFFVREATLDAEREKVRRLREASGRLLRAVNALTGSVTGRDELDGAVAILRDLLAETEPVASGDPE